MRYLLVLSAFAWAQTTFYSQDFNSGVPSDWALNTTDMGGTSSGYNKWVVGADYNTVVTSVQAPCILFSPPPMCFTVGIPQIPVQPAAIPGNPNSSFLHIAFDGDFASSNGCTAPPQNTTSFFAPTGTCGFGSSQSYFAKMTQPISIPAGTAPVKLSFFWLCEGGANNYGEVLYSTNGTTWFGLTSSVTGTQQLRYRFSNQWWADTITLPITRPANLYLAFRFVNNATTAASDPPLAVDAVRVFEVSVAQPTLTVDNATPNPVCAGSTLSVSYTAQNFPPGTQYTAQLLDASNTVVASATGASPISVSIPNTLPSGTYTVRVQASGTPPTNSSNTLTVTVVNLQSLSCTANPNPTQPNTQVTLTLNGTNLPAGPFNITLNPGDGSSNQTQNNVATLPASFTHTYATAGTYTATFTITHPASGCTGTCQVPVTVQPPTANTIDFVSVNPTTVCAGASITATFTPTGTFNAGNLFRVQLSDATGSFAAPQNIGVGATSPITATIPTTVPSGNYRVRIQSTSPVVISDTLDLVVVNLSNLSCSYSSPAIAGATVTLTLGGTGLPNGPFNITLNPGDGSPVQTQNNVATLPVNFPHTYATAGNYTATFTITHPASGCTGTCQVTVSVQPPPTSTIDLTTVTPSPVCAGSSITVNFTTSGSFDPTSQFQLQLSDATGAFGAPQIIASGSASPLTGNIPTSVASGTYRVRVVSTSPAAISDTLDLVVVNLTNLTCTYTPNPATVGTATTLTIDGTGLPAGPFNVTLDADGDGTIDYTQNGVNLPYSFTHTYSAGGSYTARFSVTDPASGCTGTCEAIVNVQGPQLSAVQLSPQALCPGEGFTIEYASTGITFAPGNTFTIEGRDGSGNVAFSCTVPGTAASGTLACTVPASTVPGTYSVTVSSSSPAYTSGALTLTVTPRPVADFAPDANLRFCAGESISFTDRSQNATSVQWDFGDGTTSTDRNPTHSYTTPGTYTVTLTAAASATCTDQLSRTIEVVPLPTASFTVNPPRLTLPEESTVTLTNTSTGAATYQWDFGNGQTSTAANPTATYDTEGEYLIVLTAISADDCRDTAQYRLSVRYAQSLTIPNAFTPNADGINDRFVIRYVGAKSIRVFLYDRWGIEIFSQQQSTPTGTIEWDGTRNGQPAPEGVYTGFLELQTLDGRSLRKSFTVTLLR